MPTVPVNIPGGARYEITVEPGLLARAGRMLRELTRPSRVAVITDTEVAPHHLPALRASLQSADFEPIVATVASGEDHKTVRTISAIYDELLPAHLDRDTPIIALGGGVVGDMAGFVAATVLRGVPLVQMPTTLLAMVDASVGGKTGVNHAVGKNLIGAFHQPIAVLIDPTVLRTLPPRELRGGLAECIKHEVIRDAEGFARLEQNIHRALALDIDYLTELVGHNVAIKARVVEADQFERGERAHLNLGHTFGHAIEQVSNYSYSHGEAVALGMAAAGFTAMKLGLIDDPTRRRINALIDKAGLPSHKMHLHVESIFHHMTFDKKVASGKIRLVLPEGIGRAAVRNDVPVELMHEAIQSLRGETRVA